MKKLVFFTLTFIFIGGGCSYKYNAEWDKKDRAFETTNDRPACNMEGEERYPELPCCGDLVISTTTSGHSVCAKPMTTSTVDQNCVPKGQQPLNDQKCCAGLEIITVDHAFSACGEPGTGYKPKVCMAEGETPFIDTPNCCAGLEPKQEGDRAVCRKLF